MRHVLSIVDDKEVHDLIKTTLKDSDIQTKKSTSLDSVKKNLPSEDLALIFLDPRSKIATKCLELLRNSEYDIPVILIVDDAQAASEVSKDDPSSICAFLYKPLNPSVLITMLDNAQMFRNMQNERSGLIKELNEYRDDLEILMKEKSETLEESLLNYYTVVEQTQEGVVIVQKGKIVFINSRFSKIIHYPQDEVLGEKISLFFPPEIDELIKKMVKKGTLKKEPEYFESNILTKEGKIIPIEVNIKETTFNKKRSTIVFIEDITERKKLQTQLIHTSNLAAIGQIAIGLAHDINTPLANISLLSENVYSRTEDEFILRKLDTMDRQVDIITGIIKNLLSVYRRSREMYSDLNINEVILDTLNITKDLLLNDLEMELQFEDEIPFLMGNPEQLGQVFLNLIINSDDSMPENGSLLIKTHHDDDFVYIDFTDNGCGIPEDKLYSIFDPFYTTKKPNKGVGLGLSICQGIIHSHNGKIDVRSEVGKGTTFTVVLRR
jgi:PAS domain S-box-containing protein